jgi:hypothetical protein
MQDLPEIERVIVLVDDLDRCLPPTVVATLEAVKLFLSVPKMAFVVAAERAETEHRLIRPRARAAWGRRGHRAGPYARAIADVVGEDAFGLVEASSPGRSVLGLGVLAIV